jgi:hypothetical protein
MPCVCCHQRRIAASVKISDRHSVHTDQELRKPGFLNGRGSIRSVASRRRRLCNRHGGPRRDWSCRIGVYGKWGEGKTSLLRFIETQARADGLISCWINPSQAEDAADLWRVVMDAFSMRLIGRNS